MAKRTLTAEDLDANPLLKHLGYKEGDEVTLSSTDDGGETKEAGHDPIGTDPTKP